MVDEVSLHVDGLDPSWYRLEPERLSLFPGAGETATLSVQLPPEAVAGSYPFRVLAASREGGAAPAGIDLNLDVPATGSLSLILEPTRRTANREARYAARLSNPGNAVRNVRLEATDPESALEFRLTPADLMLSPGETASAEVRVRARRGNLANPLRAFPFAVAAHDSDAPLDVPLAEAGGELQQAPLLPWLAALPAGLRGALPLVLPAALLLGLLGWLLGAPGLASPFVPAPAPPEAAAGLTPGPGTPAGPGSRTPPPGTAPGPGGARVAGPAPPAPPERRAPGHPPRRRRRSTASASTWRTPASPATCR